MHQTIIQVGESVLRTPAKALSLEEIRSEKIQTLIEDMKETMRKAPGVGLAAPQIGVNLQIAVIEDRAEYTAGFPENILKERGREPVPFHVIINPILTITDATEVFYFEGCLSISGVSRIIPRAKSVRVQCLNEKGNQRIINATGWYARILQHEIDHLNGKLFIDRSHKKTEIILNEANRKKWFQASQQEIAELYSQLTKK